MILICPTLQGITVTSRHVSTYISRDVDTFQKVIFWHCHMTRAHLQISRLLIFLISRKSGSNILQACPGHMTPDALQYHSDIYLYTHRRMRIFLTVWYMTGRDCNAVWHYTLIRSNIYLHSAGLNLSFSVFHIWWNWNVPMHYITIWSCSTYTSRVVHIS